MQERKSSEKIAVIGGGIVGCTTAFQLTKLGYNVCLIDPNLNKETPFSEPMNGSTASLGVLMGYVYRRSSGRSWRLRKRSMELWPQIINEINSSKQSLNIKTPLIQLANSEEEMQSMEYLVKKKHLYGIELINKDLNKTLSSVLNIKTYGGIISHKDGRIDPLILLESLMQELNTYQVDLISDHVNMIKRKFSNSHKSWEIVLSDGRTINKTIIVICASLDSQRLLKFLGHKIILKGILGQAIEIRADQRDLSKFASIINLGGINMIPIKNNKLLIGATLEEGSNPDAGYLEKMLTIFKTKENWINKNAISKKWYGIRAQPIGAPSPLLQHLEPRLILNTGHYRNGVLLAPACAEWVSQEIENLS